MNEEETVACTSLAGDTVQVPRTKLTFRPTAYGVAVGSGDVLLMRGQTSGKLWFPGGGIEAGEAIADTIGREFVEEAGVAVEVGRFLLFKEEFFYHEVWDKAFHSLRFYYACTPLSKQLASDEDVLDDESKRPRWVSVESLDPTAFDQEYGFEVLRMALDHV